jgi:hypothetical protein
MDVSKQHPASIFSVKKYADKFAQKPASRDLEYVPPKRRRISIGLQAVTSQKITFFIEAEVKEES